MVYNRYKGFKKFYYLTLGVVLSVSFWLCLGLTMAMFHSNEPYDLGTLPILPAYGCPGTSLGRASIRTN